MKLNGSTIGKTREELEYEKAAILAELDYDQTARHLSDQDTRDLRTRFSQIQNQLRAWD